MKAKLKALRLAFPALYEPKAVGTSKDLYFSAAFPIVPNSENAKVLDQAIEAAAKEKWGAKAGQILTAIREKGDIAFKKRGLTNGEGDVYDGFQDMWSLNASLNSKRGRVLLLDQDKTPLIDKENGFKPYPGKEGRIYAGCYVNVSLEIWCQDNQYGKKINAQLSGVQFAADGDAFAGGASATADDFDDLSEGAGAEGLV